MLDVDVEDMRILVLGPPSGGKEQEQNAFWAGSSLLATKVLFAFGVRVRILVRRRRLLLLLR